MQPEECFILYISIMAWLTYPDTLLFILAYNLRGINLLRAQISSVWRGNDIFQTIVSYFTSYMQAKPKPYITLLVNFAPYMEPWVN